MSDFSRARLHLEFRDANPDFGAHWEASAVDAQGNLHRYNFPAQHECVRELFFRITAPPRPSEMVMAAIRPEGGPKLHHAIRVEPSPPYFEPDTWAWRCECGKEMYGYSTEDVARTNGETHLEEVKTWREAQSHA